MQTPLYSQLESEIIGITKRAFIQLYQPGGMLHKQESAAQITPEDFKITVLPRSVVMQQTRRLFTQITMQWLRSLQRLEPHTLVLQPIAELDQELPLVASLPPTSSDSACCMNLRTGYRSEVVNGQPQAHSGISIVAVVGL